MRKMGVLLPAAAAVILCGTSGGWYAGRGRMKEACRPFFFLMRSGERTGRYLEGVPGNMAGTGHCQEDVRRGPDCLKAFPLCGAGGGPLLTQIYADAVLTNCHNESG